MPFFFIYIILVGGRSLVSVVLVLGRVILGAVGGICWKGTESEKEGEGGSGKVVL